MPVAPFEHKVSWTSSRACPGPFRVSGSSRAMERLALFLVRWSRTYARTERPRREHNHYSCITPDAQSLLTAFTALHGRMRALVGQEFGRVFDDGPSTPPRPVPLPAAPESVYQQQCQLVFAYHSRRIVEGREA